MSMKWSGYKESQERAILVQGQGSQDTQSYDSFSQVSSSNSISSALTFLRRRKGNNGIPLHHLFFILTFVILYSRFLYWVQLCVLLFCELQRVLHKDGTRSFYPINVHKRRRKFASDIFTTLLELKWRWVFATCVITYFGSWLFFAALWYLIVHLHGDFAHLNDPLWAPCVTGVRGFHSVFLFSVETQHTIGFGFHHLNDNCTSGIILICLQSIVGVILEGLVVGVVFLKLSRAKKRSETILFSPHAVICHRDGRRFFMFRVADTRTSYLLEAHVRAQMVTKRVTAEGELLTHVQKEIKVGGDGEKEDKLTLFYPTTVVHEIDEESPLKSLRPFDLHPHNNSFEIIVILEGVVETTGLMTQARTSYAPHEIRWGCRFQEISYSKSSSGERIIDFGLFDATVAEEEQITPT